MLLFAPLRADGADRFSLSEEKETEGEGDCELIWTRL